jgi:hypothetical protein
MSPTSSDEDFLKSPVFEVDHHMAVAIFLFEGGDNPERTRCVRACMSQIGKELGPHAGHLTCPTGLLPSALVKFISPPENHRLLFLYQHANSSAD